MDRDDEIGFREWAQSGLGALLRFGFAITHDEGGAEALVAASLARTLLAWPVPGPDDYVRRAMVNEQVRQWRRPRRRRPEPIAAREAVPDAGATSDDTELRERDRVWRELVNLPPRQRAVMVLRYYEDRSEEEVASVLALPVATVRREASAAAATLRSGQIHRLVCA